jgi:hypothetical protein
MSRTRRRRFRSSSCLAPAPRFTASLTSSLGELGEQQRLVALREDLVEDLLEPDRLPRAAADLRTVVQQLGGVVADLLELRHRGQDVAAPGDPLGLLDLRHDLVHHRLIERGLLGGEMAVLLDLDLVGEVVDDRLVGLESTQDVRAGDRAQQLDGFGLPVAFDGLGVPDAEEFGGGTEDAGVEEVHDGTTARRAGSPTGFR